MRIRRLICVYCAIYFYIQSRMAEYGKYFVYNKINMDKQQAEKPLTHSNASNSQQNEQKMKEGQNNLPSQFFETYQEEFSETIEPSQEEVIGKILSSEKFQLKQTWTDEIVETFINTDYQSISIQVHYGFFSTKIHLINLKLQYSFDEEGIIGKGQFGIVYNCLFQNKIIAVKAIKLNLDNSPDSIKKIYKQYFIALLASELQIGPKILNAFGYDLVFINNHAFFAMQKCYQIQPHESRLNLQIKKAQLMMSLKKLHSLKIVHRDIKPNNICWSPTFSKYVLIDFGLSTLIKETRGSKTYSIFVGTLAYSYEDLKKLYILRQAGFVDFYYNDLNGLKLSLSHLARQQAISNLKQTQFAHKINETNKNNSFISRLLQIMLIKKLCYEEQFQKALEIMRNLNYMFSSCLEILERTIDTQMVTRSCIKAWIKMRTEIFERIKIQKYQNSQADEILSDYLKRVQSGCFIVHLIPFKIALNHRKININQVIKDRQWIERLFNILNPSFNGYFFNNNYKKFAQYAVIIVNQIYSHNGWENTTIYAKKLRRVYLFFYEKFKEYRDVRALISLSELFMLLGDIINASKIRHFAISLIQDPFQLALACLSYFMLSQRCLAFRLPTNQMSFLDTVLMTKEPEKQYKRAKGIKLIKAISRQFKKFLNCNNCCYEAQSLFEIFLAIDYNLTQLQANLVDTQQFETYYKILEIFLGLLSKFLIKCIQNNITSLFGQEIDKLMLAVQQRNKHLVARKKIVGKVFVNCQDLSNIDKDLTKMLCFTKNYSLIVEICQFYYEICEGRVNIMSIQFCNILLEHFMRDPKIAVYVLTLKAKWIDKNNLVVCQYNTLYVELHSIMNMTMKIALEGDKQICQRYFSQCEPKISKIVEHYEKKVAKQISGTSERLIIEQIICMIRSMKSFMDRNDKDSLQKIHEISVSMRDEVLCRCGMMEFIMNQIGFIAALSRIRAFRLLTENSSYPKLDQQIIGLWQSVNFPIGAITTNHILEQLISINHDRKKFAPSYALLCRIIQIVNFNPGIYRQNNVLEILRQGFSQFCATTPSEVLGGLIKHYINMKKLPLIVEEEESGLFLCFMFQASYKNLTTLLFLKSLFFLANVLDTMDSFCQLRATAKYFSIFANQLKKNKRKSLILQRQRGRANFKIGQQKWLRLSKLVKERSHFLKQQIRQKIASKIYILQS